MHARKNRGSIQVLALLLVWLLVAPGWICFSADRTDEGREIGDRLELMVDPYLIASMRGTQVRLQEPRDEGAVLQFDEPWEGRFCGYCTVIRDGERFRLYYRGKPTGSADGKDETTCVAESADGVHWVKPMVGLVEYGGHRSNNIVLALEQLSHNFSPLVDTHPAVSPDQRYKALAGTMRSGLFAFVSADGLRWRKLSEQPVFAGRQLPCGSGFDSQNVAFWSPQEQRYLMFFRVNEAGIRRIGRAESEDFVHWTNGVLMEYRGADGGATVLEHLYINQTHPYFRAPHLYLSLAARFMPGRQVISAEEAQAIQVHPSYFKDTSDAVLLTSRGGKIYDRTFLNSFIRPGIGPRNWVSRTTYPALNLVQTGPTEMSLYANQDYAQPTAHLERYSLPLDRLASVRAPYEGGELLTRPLTFKGTRLLINFSTSAAGSVRVEIQDPQGGPVSGFGLEDSVEAIGNEIERVVRWKNGPNTGGLAGRPVRLRFVMKDADLYAIRFQ